MIAAELSEASPADAEEISALSIKTYVETFGAEFDDPAELTHHLEQTISVPRWRQMLACDRVLVARIEGRGIGYVQFGPGDAGGEMVIRRLYVDAAFQGQGIGTDLLRRALLEPEVAAAPVIRIDVWEKNLGAQKLYARFGFRDEGGREPFVLSTGEIDGYDLILIRRKDAALVLADGRRVFGEDAANYDKARPPYPDRVFELLRDRCGLAAGTQVLEIGPGTGLATRPLLAAGASLVAIEPDERLAAVLRERTAGGRLRVIVSTFEDADLPRQSFDLGCSATAFHWLEQRPALAKMANLLRPGGHWAMWWNVFGDPARPDPFHDATQELLSPLNLTPSNTVSWKHPFALDREARMADLQAVGAFADIAVEVMAWTLVLSAEQVRALYATYSSINALDADNRLRILDALRDVAEREFGGRVERKMLTPVYTCRRV